MKLKAISGVNVEGARLLESNSGATYAEVRVNGKGPLTFAYLTLDSFSKGSRLPLWRVGDHRPHIVRFGEIAGMFGERPSFANALDVSVLSPFDRVLPAHSSTVAEVVTNYDVLLKFLESWPTCPTSAGLVGADGAQYRYCVQRWAEGSSAEPEYPKEWDSVGSER